MRPTIKYEDREGNICTSDKALGRINKDAFEMFILSLDRYQKRITVRPLTQGKSGAAVFLVEAVTDRYPLNPVVIKGAVNPTLIINEWKNYNQYVSNGKLRIAPSLRPITNPLFLAYDYPTEFKNPITFRYGYFENTSEILGKVIKKMVKDLSEWHKDGRFRDKVTNIERMEFFYGEDRKPLPLALRFAALGKELSSYSFLPELWQKFVNQRKFSSPKNGYWCHGDLNVGNLMFDIPLDNPVPLVWVIDFASIIDGISFWDFAKFERDLKTRLFLRDALDNNYSIENIVKILKFIDASWENEEDNKQILNVPEFAIKAINCIAALRGKIKESWGLATFKNAYYDTLLFSTLTVLYRDEEDEQIPLSVQRQIACESANFLLKRLLPDSEDSLPLECSNKDSGTSIPSKPELEKDKEKIYETPNTVLSNSFTSVSNQKNKVGGREMIYLPVRLRRKDRTIEIIPHQDSTLVTERMDFADWRERLFKMEALLRAEDDIEIDNVGLAIGIQNFLYKDGRLYAGVRTKARASEHEYKTGSVIASGSFNTGYELLKKNVPETGSLVQLDDPDYLQDLFKVIDRKRKHFVEIDSAIHKMISDKCGVYQGRVKFRNGEFRLAVIFVNNSRYFPRFEVGICKYIDISNFESGIEIIDSFGEDTFEDQNYWIWVSDGEIFYRSYKSEYYILPNNEKKETCKKAILVTNGYFEQASGKIERYIPIATDEHLNQDVTLNRPFSSPARSLLEFF